MTDTLATLITMSFDMDTASIVAGVAYTTMATEGVAVWVEEDVSVGAGLGVATRLGVTAELGVTDLLEMGE
jgi:hypothetical protein